MTFGDFWQLKPVHGTAIFSDPANAKTLLARHGLELFWGSPPQSIHRCWNFSRSLRCDDAWYNKFLGECRDGCLTEQMYNFIHGFPISMPVALGDSLADTDHLVPVWEYPGERLADTDHLVPVWEYAGEALGHRPCHNSRLCCWRQESYVRMQILRIFMSATGPL